MSRAAPTTLRIAAIGLDLGASVSLDSDVDAAWYGYMSNGSGPMVTVRVERMWDEGAQHAGITIGPKHVYRVIVGCKSVTIESDWHGEVMDAWDELCEEAGSEAPRLAGEIRVLTYAEANRIRKSNSEHAHESAEGGL